MSTRSVWYINPDIEKDLEEFANKLPPGEQRNDVWRIIRKTRARRVSTVTPLRDAAEERLQAFSDECDERNARRTLSVQITDPEGAQMTITGTTNVVVEYLNIVIDGLDCLDGYRAKLNALDPKSAA